MPQPNLSDPVAIREHVTSIYHTFSATRLYDGEESFSYIVNNPIAWRDLLQGQGVWSNRAVELFNMIADLYPHIEPEKRVQETFKPEARVFAKMPNPPVEVPLPPAPAVPMSQVADVAKTSQVIEDDGASMSGRVGESDTLGGGLVSNSAPPNPVRLKIPDPFANIGRAPQPSPDSMWTEEMADRYPKQPRRPQPEKITPEEEMNLEIHEWISSVIRTLFSLSPAEAGYLPVDDGVRVKFAYPDGISDHTRDELNDAVLGIIAPMMALLGVTGVEIIPDAVTDGEMTVEEWHAQIRRNTYALPRKLS